MASCTIDHILRHFPQAGGALDVSAPELLSRAMARAGAAHPAWDVGTRHYLPI
jgi:hypothetical protein